jgi:hypothetical protein
MSDRPYKDPEEVAVLTTGYLRRLIIEAPYIRARLYNPGGSVVLQQTAATTEQQQAYSPVIGNTFHNDLIEAEQVLNEKFSKGDRDLLYEWAAGMSAQQASEYYGVKGSLVRKRRQRAVQKLHKELDGRANDRRSSDTDAPRGQQEPGEQPS